VYASSEYGEIFDVQRRSVPGARHDAKPQMQGPDLRHASVEGQTRARHGQNKNQTAREAAGGEWN
jgi:hypothetical protein